MKKKKLFSIAALILACILLCSCASTPVQQLRAFVQEQRGEAEERSENCVSFREMEYVRPDISGLEQAVDAVESALAGGMESGGVIELLDVCYADYYSFSTMYTLANIRYLLDLTDEYYEQEYGWCGETYSQVQQIMERLYNICACSAIGGELEEEYFWEGFVSDYGEGSESVYTDRAVELMQRESELVADYYAMQSAMQTQAAQDGVSVQALDAQYNERFAQIYIALVRVRREMAEEMGYDSYEQLQYASYERDYSPEEAERYAQDIKEYIAPLYAEVFALLPYSAIDYSYMSERRLIGALSAAARSMGGDIEEAFDFMRRFDLYDVSQSDTKADMSFTVYMDSCEAPFMSITPYSDTEDILTAAHEFGHYADAYINYNAYESLDLSEVFSQAMEYLVMPYLADILDADELTALREIKLLNTLDMYAAQASFARFESRVYAMDDGELCAETINAAFLESAIEYDYIDETDGEDYAMRWQEVTHFFESPFYVISYPVSNDAALQLYELETEEPGEGLEKYRQLLSHRGSTLIDTLEAAGLESPFAAGRVESAALQLRGELDALTLRAAA